MNYLDQKVVVITGASSGLGAASARALAVYGVRIVAAAIDGPGLAASDKQGVTTHNGDRAICMVTTGSSIRRHGSMR